MTTKNSLPLRITLALGLFLIAAPRLRAGCTIDFEDLPVGTAVTNQYAGVTFLIGNLGGGCPPMYMRIATAADGTSSPTRCLKIDQGCPDLSPEYLRMVFSTPHSQVSFFVGEMGGISYRIRAYSTTTGTGGLISSFSVSTPSAGVHQFVNVSSATPIVRIEVESDPGGYFEAIDDLVFDADVTAPIAEISSPAFGTSVCGDHVGVLGRACDPDGAYGRDTLEYMPVTGATWTLVGSYNSPVCTPNTGLYDWPTAGVPDGIYFLRLTVTNKCGLRNEAITVVVLDRAIDSVGIRSPTSSTILGGTVCIDGFASDRCFSQYTVERTAGGSFIPVDPLKPNYKNPVVYDPLGQWNTADNTAPDGDYLLRVTVFDTCGHSNSQQITVTVDNTAPIGMISEPTECSKRFGIVPVSGTASDAHLGAWVLQYSDPVTHQWHYPPIASGSGAVINGLFANWDTTGLPACAYTLRLVVTDQSKVNLDCSGNSGVNQVEYLVSLDIVNGPLAVDSDGDGMPDVWENQYNFNPFNPADAAQDADGDGQSNLAEYRAGTDPKDPNSHLRITAIAKEGPDTRVTWTTTGSHHYLLKEGPTVSGRLPNTASPLISIPPGGPSTTSFLHLDGATAPQRFYRVEVVP